MLLVLWPAVLAGTVAIAVTVAIERFGGVVGGLLGTMPTTILPAAWGIWAAAPDPDTFAAAMGSAPVGMLLATLFLLTWRLVPPLLPPAPVLWQLAAMVGVSLVAWSLLAAMSVAVLGASPLPVWQVGAAALLVNVVLGVWASARRVPAPAGERSVPVTVLIARGVLAGVAVGVAAGIAHSGDGLLAGIASVFPAIFLTTMAGLWLSQGRAVPAGAVGPMMLGATSVGTFALLAIPLFPGLGLGLGSLVAWLVAVVAVTVPAMAWLRNRRR